MASWSILDPNLRDTVQDQTGIKGREPWKEIASRILLQGLPLLQEQLDFQQSHENQRQSLYDSILRRNSPGNVRQTANRQKNAVYQNANRSGQNAARAARGMGYGDGVSSALLGSSLNQGARQASMIDDKYNDPSYLSGLDSQALSILNGMQPSYFSTLGNLASIGNTGQQKQQGSGSALGSLAGIIGAFL